MKCEFRKVRDGLLKCRNCGYKHKSKWPASKIHRTCPRSPSPVPLSPADNSKCGRALHLLLLRDGHKPTKHCACTRMAAEMDRNGLEWCKQNKDKPIATMVAEAKRQGSRWPKMVLRRGAERYVDAAIKIGERRKERRRVKHVRFAPIETRHLIYHVYAAKSNDIWRQNLEELTKRWDVFNGRKVIAIAIDGDTESLRCVVDALPPDVEFVIRQNDKELREVKTFLPLLESIETTDPHTAIFYGHTKGNTTRDNVDGARLWRIAAYHHLLDRWQECMEDLERYSAVGIHKMQWPEGTRPPYPTRLAHGNWMFAGTFFWFRADQVFTHDNWRHVPQDRYGAEAYLSGQLPAGEAKSMYQLWDENSYPTPSPYNPAIYVR